MLSLRLIDPCIPRLSDNQESSWLDSWTGEQESFVNVASHAPNGTRNSLKYSSPPCMADHQMDTRVCHFGPHSRDEPMKICIKGFAIGGRDFRGMNQSLKLGKNIRDLLAGELTRVPIPKCGIESRIKA